MGKITKEKLGSKKNSHCMIRILPSELSGMSCTVICIAVGVTDMVRVTQTGLESYRTNLKVQSLIHVAKLIQKDVEHQLQMEILILYVLKFLLMAVWKLLKIN